MAVSQIRRLIATMWYRRHSNNRFKDKITKIWWIIRQRRCMRVYTVRESRNKRADDRRVCILLLQYSQTNGFECVCVWSSQYVWISFLFFMPAILSWLNYQQVRQRSRALALIHGNDSKTIHSIRIIIQTQKNVNKLHTKDEKIDKINEWMRYSNQVLKLSNIGCFSFLKKTVRVCKPFVFDFAFDRPSGLFKGHPMVNYESSKPVGCSLYSKCIQVSVDVYCVAMHDRE